jgi:hypothetical protein
MRKNAIPTTVNGNKNYNSVSEAARSVGANVDYMCMRLQKNDGRV